MKLSGAWVFQWMMRQRNSETLYVRRFSRCIYATLYFSCVDILESRILTLCVPRRTRSADSYSITSLFLRLISFKLHWHKFSICNNISREKLFLLSISQWNWTTDRFESRGFRLSGSTVNYCDRFWILPGIFSTLGFSIFSRYQA